MAFLAPMGLITLSRLKIVWAIILLRHPLLASQVEMEEGDYDSARFVWVDIIYIWSFDVVLISPGHIQL